MSSPMARKVGIYVRISRDKAGAGLGVDRQIADCRALAESKTWTVVHVYEDNDLSAYSGKSRPNYRRLLGDIERGAIDTVIVWHTDRLHRQPAELEEWISVCDPRDVEVHTVKAGSIDLSTPTGRVVARIVGDIARFESEHRSERVKSKMDQIARAGGFLGGPRPFGYLDGGMDLHPGEAPLIAEGTRMILRGMSLRSVVTAWNNANTTTTKSGKPWQPATVRDVLMRARNAKILVHRGQEVGPAGWERIVSEDEWRGVCAILADPKRRTSPGNQPRWLGSGIYRCGIAGCDGRLVVGTSGQGRHPSYLCRSYRERPGGRHVTRAAPALDEYIGDAVVARLSMPEMRDVFTVSRPEVDVAAVRAALGAIDAQRTEVAVRAGRGEITMAMLDGLNTGLLERQRVQEALLARAVALDPVHELVHEIDVAAAWKGYDLDRQRAILVRTLDVTVLPAPRGRRPGGDYFDPDGVRIDVIGSWQHVDPVLDDE